MGHGYSLTIAGILMSCALVAVCGSADQRHAAFEEALALAHQLDDSDEGKAYEMQLFMALGPRLQQAMNECTSTDTPEHYFRLLFQVESAKIANVLPEPGQTVAACVAPRFVGLPVPPAPSDKWVVSIRMTVKP